ncbi:MAG TPA: hypothetical protein DER58_03035, partial [Firmicutes bacterium]|nr:hypothetical protein [Bacillota bacterium]
AVARRFPFEAELIGAEGRSRLAALAIIIVIRPGVLAFLARNIGSESAFGIIKHSDPLGRSRQSGAEGRTRTGTL